jgi:hypothetical protein
MRDAVNAAVETITLRPDGPPTRIEDTHDEVA